MTRRTFDSLRRTEGVVEVAVAPGTIEAAMQSIAQTVDGRHLLAWLRATALQPTHPAASADQLREAEGARRAHVTLLDMAEANPTVR